ncbi:MAG: 50S ribosomal protein L25 [Chthoniobacterales bacterium]
MAKQVKLSAQPRTLVGRNSVKQLRSRGVVPANIYGHKSAPMNLEINNQEIKRLLAHAAGENILVELEIAAVADDKTVVGKSGKTVAGKSAKTVTSRLGLIQEVQHHPVRGDILHVDFLEVSMNEMLNTEVPIEVFGEAEGVKNYGGLLEQLVRSLHIQCLPKDLPETIRVDISALGLGQSLHIRDINLPEGVTATSDPELTVFLVAEPKVVDENAKIGEVQQSPEVIKEKKPSADGESKK